VQRVIVSGASGFVGRQVAAELTRAGHDVVGVGRHESDGPWRHFVCLDVGDSSATWPVREGDVVVHAAGIAHDLSGTAVDESEYHRVNAEGARNAASATLDGGGRAFILLSTVKVFGDATPYEGVDDGAPARPLSPYGRSKLDGERFAEQVLTPSEVVLTTLRLNPVYGPGAKGNLDRLVRLSQSRIVPWLPRRSGRRSMVHVDDVARLVAALVARPVRGTFIVDDGEAYTPRQVQELCRGRTRPPWSPVVPALALRAAGRIGSALAPVATIPFTSADTSRLLDHAVYRSDRLRAEVGWSPSHTLAETLRDDVRFTGPADR
jgi:UDP-glucose 4-epimerase